MDHRSFIAALFVTPGLYASASAQLSGDVILNALIGETCVVTLSSSGTMVPNGGLNQLSSELSGGDRADALIVTTSTNFDVVVDAPTSFSTAPVGGDTGVTYSALFTATGVTTLTDVDDDTAAALGLGSTTITVGATADRASGVFPAGSYQLPVTVRCVAS